ncbi:OmpA family protein [Myxococcota bacterium]|nr:OmpA family protein [Myxococcota bacterium]
MSVFHRYALAFGVAALALAAPGGARAQMIPRSVEVDLTGGYYWFADPDSLENFRDGAIAGVRLGIHFTEYIGLEAAVEFVPTTTKFSNQWVYYLTPHLDLVMHLTNWNVVPFLVVGAGFSRYDIDDQGCREAECTGPMHSDPAIGYGASADPNIDFYFNAGAGAKFMPHPRFGFRIDGRYVLTLGPGGPNRGTPDLRPGHEGEYNDQFNHVQLTGSIIFLAGGNLAGKDRDGDGIPDKQDACRDAAEDKDGFEDGDGCPDPDNDKDGILDTADRCPASPEDLDGFEDADGCPEPDNDGDVVNDSLDQCPDQPEDRDGFRDTDGCPEADNDEDGILDADDQCPNMPEEFNGIEDQDGCPENDADNDGVFDAQDRCPRDAEDRDGFEDLDGCPDPDNDRDGVPDAGDRCPDVAEDPDGFEDLDGCPDRDNDQDAILDEADACPNAPETINSFEDKDGCPDEIPKQLERFVGVIRGIQFRVNSDELLPSSHAILNDAAAILAKYPSIRLEIQGHASADGDDQKNLDLSQDRAESVMRYLVNRGIGPDRLVAAGYGESVPIASNDSEEGRVMNRRVEFKILEGVE